MIRHSEYGFEWELDEDPKKGQLGLLRENHYKSLFAPENRVRSFGFEDVWLDIGANIGAFAIRAAPLVQQVVAVEPDPEAYLQLVRNIELNGLLDTDKRLGKVYPLKGAVIGGPSKWVTLSRSNSYTSTHRLGRIRGRKTVEVAGLNINELFRDYPINKIKMDCEGSEVEILEGMSIENLERLDEIIFEYHFAMLKDKNWSVFYSLLERLKRRGLTIVKQPAERTKTWHTIVWAKRL